MEFTLNQNIKSTQRPATCTEGQAVLRGAAVAIKIRTTHRHTGHALLFFELPSGTRTAAGRDDAHTSKQA